MSYRDDLDAAHARAAAAEQRESALRKQLAGRDASPTAVPIPERFEVSRAGDELVVRWRWFRRMHLFLALFAVAWNVFLLNWYAIALRDGSLVMLVFPIAHVAVGIGLVYTTLAGFLNHTVVTATRDELRVEHGPLRWRTPSRTIARAELAQLYVAAKQQQTRQGPETTYDVCALLDNGRQVKLVERLDGLDLGLYLEHAFEEHLGIVDRPVRGEVPKAA